LVGLYRFVFLYLGVFTIFLQKSLAGDSEINKQNSLKNLWFIKVNHFPDFSVIIVYVIGDDEGVHL